MSFTYEKTWINDSGAFALSCALPFKEESFGHRLTMSFFENLIPEESARKAIEDYMRIPATGFAFLKEFGADCAGAITISPDPNFSLKIDYTKKKEIPLKRVYEVIRENRSLIQVDENAHFSLAGAQNKLAIIYEDDRIFIPTAGAPTTHIIKPPITTFTSTKDSVYNECFCMHLAKAVGLDVPKVRVIEGEIPLFLVDRYDRKQEKLKTIRLHQEDLCQVQGITSSRKYESQGGPNISDNYRAILQYSSNSTKDLEKYLVWISYNLCIGNNDSHSKNISFLHTDNDTTLSPFYDLISTAVYPETNQKFAFTINGKSSNKHSKPEDFAAVEKVIGVRNGFFCRIFVDVLKNICRQLGDAKKDFLSTYESKSAIQAANKVEVEITKRASFFKHNGFKF